MPQKFIWNWQQPDWPKFRYDRKKLEALEAEFLLRSGVFMGAFQHIALEEKRRLTVDFISDEALNTSEIEGEVLDRASLQSSIRRNFGMPSDRRKIPPAEQGIAEMMVDLHENFAEPLTHALLFRWHAMLMNGQRDVKSTGCYRASDAPMQIVSGSMDFPKVHYEAPPSARVGREMTRFLKWFNQTAPQGKTPLPALTRAGIAHWHFVSIHPFEDGNGRISRALAEKALSQTLGQSTLIALSQAINKKRKNYYKALESNSRDNGITGWLLYFAQTILEAQTHSRRMVNFLIEKTKFFDRLRGNLNGRQEKAALRMFREGPEGFKDGLSAENYIRITGTSRATTTRDLQDLVKKNAFTKTGELKSTRYHLNIGPY